MQNDDQSRLLDQLKGLLKVGPQLDTAVRRMCTPLARCGRDMARHRRRQQHDPAGGDHEVGSEGEAGPAACAAVAGDGRGSPQPDRSR